MNTSQRIAKGTRLMKIGGGLTALSMLIVLCTTCSIFFLKHDPAWIFILCSFIAGAICAGSLMNAFVVTHFIKAAISSPTETPPR